MYANNNENYMLLAYGEVTMKGKIIISVIASILAIITIWGIIYIGNFKLKDKSNVVTKDTTSDKITTEDLKKELGATGNSNIYTLAEEGGGRKILAVKPEIEYNVALAGALNKQKAVTFDNLNTMLENGPDGSGIWITEDSRDSFVKMLSQLTEGKYNVDSRGYLVIESEGHSAYDEEIKKLIHGNKLYAIDVAGVSYIIDTMTGEILENPFEEMDPYQTYTYYENDDKKLIILTTNKAKKLNNQEIIDSLIELCK